MTSPNGIATAQHQLWKIDGLGIAGWFGTKEGGETAADAEKVRDGGELEPEVLTTPAETSNITLTKLYRPGKHRVAAYAAKAKAGRLRVTVFGYDTDPDLGPVGDPVVYPEAVVLRVKVPDYDANSSDASYMEFEVAVGREAAPRR